MQEEKKEKKNKPNFKLQRPTAFIDRVRVMAELFWQTFLLTYQSFANAITLIALPAANPSPPTPIGATVVPIVELP